MRVAQHAKCDRDSHTLEARDDLAERVGIAVLGRDDDVAQLSQLGHMSFLAYIGGQTVSLPYTEVPFRGGKVTAHVTQIAEETLRGRPPPETCPSSVIVSGSAGYKATHGAPVTIDEIITWVKKAEQS